MKAFAFFILCIAVIVYFENSKLIEII